MKMKTLGLQILLLAITAVNLMASEEEPAINPAFLVVSDPLYVGVENDPLYVGVENDPLYVGVENDPLYFPPPLVDTNLNLLDSESYSLENFYFVEHGGMPIQSQLGGVPVVEMRTSELKRKSRILLYLHCANPFLLNQDCRIELHCIKANPTCLGELKSKREGFPITVRGFMELVVPLEVLNLIRNLKLENISLEWINKQLSLNCQQVDNILYLRLFIGVLPPFTIPFYPTNRLTKDLKNQLKRC